MAKRNPNSNFMWQKPRQGYIHYTDEQWYKARIVGHDALEWFMKTLIKNAHLSNDLYTNHSIRATCIGTLDNSGFEGRHIMAISSHKNESTIKTYSTKCPESKKHQMYQALNESVIPKKKFKPEATAQKPLETINVNQVQDIVAVDQNQNFNQNITKNSTEDQDLPPNFQLFPFENEETDDFLLEYLKKNPDENTNQEVTTTKTVTTNLNNMTTMPIIPKMYFPNSNVTINYNFGK